MQCMLMTDWLKMDPILSLFLYSETLQYDFTNPPIKKQSQKKKKKEAESIVPQSSAGLVTCLGKSDGLPVLSPGLQRPVCLLPLSPFAAESAVVTKPGWSDEDWWGLSNLSW